MSKYRFLLIIPFIAIMLIAWYIVASNDGTKLRKQRELLELAAGYAEDKVYVKAIPLAVEAYNIDTEIKFTEVEDILMGYYLDGGYTEEYYSMINDRINGDRAEREEYISLAEYYFGEEERAGGLAVLEKAILKYDSDKLPAYYGIKGLTGEYSGTLYSDEFTELYEKNRYSFSQSMSGFRELGDTVGKYMTVKDEETGLWALYSSSGKRLTDSLYTEVSNISDDGFASVKLDNEYLLVDIKGVRYALCKNDSVTGLVRTEGENKTVVMCSDGLMHMATDMQVGEKGYDFLGASSEGFRAVCDGGVWRLSDGKDTRLYMECQDIKVNAYGEAAVSGRVFIKNDGAYRLADLSGNIYDGIFEDAKPFCSGGRLAAVKQNGKWGFADRSGNIVIECIYDDAQSFCGKNVGTVRCDDGMWRFIDVRGNVIDEYEFFDAREFGKNLAAVKGLEEKWSLVTIN